jgi:uncharacterized membrane protein YeaQ/YmgE (transglycosylase-associated protein family)
MIEISGRKNTEFRCTYNYIFYRWIGAIVALLLTVCMGLYVSDVPLIVPLFLFSQDLPLAAVSIALIVTLLLVSRSKLLLHLLPIAASEEMRSWTIAALAFLVALLTWWGNSVIYHSFALAVDESLATFDAAIIRTGRLFAPVQAEWRPYVAALQPVYMLEVPGNTFWSSTYLPVNAAVRSLFGILGSEPASGAFWAALSLVLQFAIARRLWPAQRHAAYLATVLLATSSQFLIAAMTPFAMAAHLALNLLWLWLFMQRHWIAQGLSAVVAFAAMGLHQLVFFPLFAIPFILQLWVDRRRKLAAFHLSTWICASLFWILHRSLMLHSNGIGPEAPAEAGLLSFANLVVSLITSFEANSIILMANNLLRLTLWQSLLLAPLFMLGIAAALRAGGFLRAILLGSVLTVVAVWILQPFQGHGWGYRYMHGLLGNLCFVATLGGLRLTAQQPSNQRAKSRALFVAAAIGSVFVLFPLRAWQVHNYVHPYASATAAIARADVDVVVVDHNEVFYGFNLVRNDPMLRNRPKVLLLSKLDAAQITTLCTTYEIGIFDASDARKFGMLAAEHVVPSPNRMLMAQAGCDHRHIASPKSGWKLSL